MHAPHINYINGPVKPPFQNPGSTTGPGVFSSYMSKSNFKVTWSLAGSVLSMREVYATVQKGVLNKLLSRKGEEEKISQPTSKATKKSFALQVTTLAADSNASHSFSHTVQDCLGDMRQKYLVVGGRWCYWLFQLSICQEISLEVLGKWWFTVMSTSSNPGLPNIEPNQLLQH